MAKHFTRQEIEEIRMQLAQQGMKDTDFIETDKFTGDDYFVIVQDGKNKKISADTFRSDYNEIAEQDHLRAMEDRQTANSDHVRAENDHSRALTDSGRASQDHNMAESDNSRALEDHRVAESDHRRAVEDHATAGNDHDRAELDHDTASEDHTKISRAEEQATAAVEDATAAVEAANNAVEDANSAVTNANAAAQRADSAANTANTAANNADTARERIQGELDKKYVKPAGGIPKSDLEQGVKDSFDLADTALQSSPVGQVSPSVDPYEYATRAELEELGQEVDDLVLAYPVTAGGSNGRDFFVNLPKGEYAFTIDENGTGNTGTFNLYFTPSSGITGTGYSCHIGIDRGVVINSTITKISVGDINSSITNSGEMLFKIRKLRSVLQRIDNRNNVEDNFSNLLHGPFVNASVVSGALNSYKAQYRACSVDILRYSRDLLIKANSGYKFGILLYSDSGTYISDSGWKTSYVVPANTNFRINISTTNDNTVLSPETGRANVLISTLLDEKIATPENSISVTGQGATGVKTTVQFLSKKVKFRIPSPWPITNIGVGGNNVLSIGYVKGGVSYDLQALNKIVMNSYFEKEFVVIFPEFDYDSTYIFIRADSGSTAKIDWEEYHDYDLIDSGRNYEGELIQPKSRFALSQIGQLNNFGTIDQTMLNAQGMAVYEDRYILQGSNRIGVGSHLLVVDIKTPSISIMTIETLAEGQGFHMNNVNLGKKYDATDILPLVYCSEFYNQHTCKVLRIANDFSSFTEVQTISYGGAAIDTTNYDWVVDAEKNLLYLISFPVSGIKMLRFNLPSTSNASVTLTDADVLETINIPNTSGKTILAQGGTIINGKLWTVFGSDTVDYPGFLAVSDLETKKMVSFADLSALGEAEAVSPYKEGVLLCVASGLVSTGASLRNPSYIYMIFNC